VFGKPAPNSDTLHLIDAWHREQRLTLAQSNQGFLALALVNSLLTDL
jgi:hypothetical protein